MSERLALPDGYKKGGRVKKAKKAKRATGKARKTPKKRAPKQGMKYLPLGGALPTTGMGSVVFGATQAPSYFRAVGSQQEFANMPDVLKGLKEGQQNIMRELERRRAQEAADRVFASQVEEEEVKPTPRWMKKVTPMSSSSASSSTRGTPLANYDFAFATPLKILLPNTLNPLERQRSDTPDMMTPMGSEFQAPGRAFPSSYEGPLSSKEAMAEPYRGADESLPPQEVASGEQMVPVSNTIEVSSSSAFAPLRASVPESQSDSLERPLLKKTFIIKRPVPAIVAPGASRAASAPRASVGPAPGDEKRAQVMVMTSDELLKEATRVGIKNAKRDYTGPGRSERLKADILARL